MQLVEKRRTPRYLFRAPAEVTDTDSPQVQVAPSGDLSHFGCFVETLTPFPRGTRIRIRIDHDGAMFTASGEVANHINEGMGIAFSTVESANQAILENWLYKQSEVNLGCAELDKILRNHAAARQT
jgi:hypothetical protein